MTRRPVSYAAAIFAEQIELLLHWAIRKLNSTASASASWETQCQLAPRTDRAGPIRRSGRRSVRPFALDGGEHGRDRWRGSARS